MIQLNDFRRQWEEVRTDVQSAVERAGSSGVYVLGENVREFEAALAARWGLAHAAGVGSGLDALEISLRILGCLPGDHVLTTPLSAFASTLAILKLGAIPVFADTDERGLIDLDRCKNLLWRRPDIRYFLPVHLYGHSLNLEILDAFRKDFQLHIVEDCAQSFGATFRGRATGTSGQVAATSFYPTKNLGAMGDGGAILTNSAEIDAQVRILRFYGETARYHHTEIGWNSRLDELQAAILKDAFLPRADRWIARRRAIAKLYIEGIRNPKVRVPGAPPDSDSSWHLFPVFVEPAQRDAFLEHLKSAEIAAGVHYPTAIPDQPVMNRMAFELTDDCVAARRLCASEVSLPVHPYLTGAEVEQVIAAVNRWS
jgi:dTDP-4-amino-4,6-dideoxygalactose transaminase